MIPVKYFSYSFVALLFFLSSCSDPNEYRVDDAFVDYLHRFENEATKRGQNFNVQLEGLIIEFDNLKDNTAGLTHYGNPIRIEIDKTYWNAISKTAGADLMKEDLIFHELGHGLLKREHLNSTLENGDWKSIMCGGTKVNGRAWNINYKGMRRDYYIDELFDESTAEPEFSSTQLMVDTAGYDSKLFLSFDSEREAGWPIGDSISYKTSIDKGRLKFQSKVDDVYLVFVKTSIFVQTDFSFELSIEYPIGGTTNQYGMIFGYVPNGSNGVNDPVEYFTINNNKYMQMGNRTWYSFFTEIQQNSILSGGKNKLKVVKVGKLLYYFINNVYVYCSEMEVVENGNRFGFMVPSKGTVYIDNLDISQNLKSSSAAYVKQNVTVEFEIKSVKSSNNTIYNQ